MSSEWEEQKWRTEAERRSGHGNGMIELIAGRDDSHRDSIGVGVVTAEGIFTDGGLIDKVGLVEGADLVRRGEGR